MAEVRDCLSFREKIQTNTNFAILFYSISLFAVTDQNKVTAWVNKIMKNNKGLGDLKLRNEFMHQLTLNVQKGELKPPFNQDPPKSALRALARQLPESDENPSQDDESVALLRFLPAKKGGHLLPKPLPQIGAYCYIAASGAPECKPKYNF